MSKVTNLAEKIGPIDGDGDDGGTYSVETVTVNVVHNGYIITVEYDDGDSMQYVEHNVDDVLKILRTHL